MGFPDFKLMGFPEILEIRGIIMTKFPGISLHNFEKIN